MEIPGFYYDKQKKKYFRIQSGNSGQNRLTNEEMKVNKALDSLEDYTQKDGTIHLPQTLHKQEINFQTKYNLKEEFIRSQLKPIKKQKTLDMEVIDFCGNQMQNIAVNSLIGNHESDRLFAVFTGDTGSVIYELSVEDIFSDDFNIDTSKHVINAFAKPNRVVDMSYKKCSNNRILSTLVHHFPNPNTINTSFSLNVLNDTEGINCMRQVYEFSEPIFSGTHFEDMNILGAEKKIYVFQPSYSGNIQIIKFTDNIMALESSSDGKFFIAGTNTGQLSCFDIRYETNRLSRRSHFKLYDKSIAYLHCLSDSYGVIVSCHDHYLCLTDLRMFTKPVLQYCSHFNDCSKIAFSVDESVDVLCSSGSDNLVRFWSISSGKLLDVYSPELENRIRSGLPTTQLSSSVWYSHSWKCLKNEFKPLMFSISGNQLNVITNESLASN